MSDLLLAFSFALVRRLVDDRLLQVRPGTEEQVVRFLAAQLSDQPELKSLVSAAAQSLVSCPDVEELFADDDELREIINGLGSA